MRPVRLAAPLAVSIAMATATPAVAAQKITAAGVGKVKLGATYRSLRDAGLVGRTAPGCELSDPKQRVARLRSPLKGFVQLTRKRRVKSVFVSGGATARGVRVGNRLRAVRAAYPGVRVDRSTEATFGIALATVPRGKGGLLQFTVGAKTNRVQGIAIPRVAFCE